MGTWLEPRDVTGVAAETAEELINELESHLSLHYPMPATLTGDQAKMLRALLIPIVRRWHEAGTGLTTQETTGPFLERKSGGGGHVLWDHEKAALRAFCGMRSGPASPRGSFPQPEPIDDLFVRRPSWPSVGW